MRQRVQVFVFCAALIAGPHLAAGAEQGIPARRVDQSLSSPGPATSQSGAEAIRNLGAPAVGTGDAGEDDCRDVLGAAAAGAGAVSAGGATSAGESIGQGLADASRMGCTPESTSAGQAVGEGARAATGAIVGE